MNINSWDERYRSRARSSEDFDARPTPLLIETAAGLQPGRVLDLACGTGRNAVWLSQRGWQVTAVDGAPAAIHALRQRAKLLGLQIETHVADLTCREFRIIPATFDLILFSYYLQRDLFAPAKAGVKPGGLILAIVHTTHGEELPTPTRLRPGELAKFFNDCEILHLREGASLDPAHTRAVAEIVARRPITNE